jgi:hypothetical protein
MSSYPVGISAPTLASVSVSRKQAGRGFFGRMLDRLIAARLRQAEIEIRRQMGMLPPHLLERGAYSLKNGHDLPFER